MTSIKSNISNYEVGKAGTFVTYNTAYFNNTISKIAPQFISVELETQGNSSITLNAYNKFKSNLDFNKLQSTLVK